MTREAVIAAARTWVGTPYHHLARKKGVGVDCGQLIIAAFTEAGVSDDVETGFYTHDWHLHRSEEKYLEVVERHMDRLPCDTEDDLDFRLIADPSFRCDPVDIIVFRVGRTFSHGGIVTKWPFMVHASVSSMIVEEVSLLNTPMSARPMRVYRFRGDLE